MGHHTQHATPRLIRQDFECAHGASVPVVSRLQLPAQPVVHPRDIGLVAAGGSVGTLARYGLGHLVPAIGWLPLGVLLANVTGAFLLAWLVQHLAGHGPEDSRRRGVRLLLGVGLLGGYTTYSLLATDVAELVLDQQIGAALAYGLGTVVVGGAATWLGILVGSRTGTRHE
ncbi:hypothetical protein CGZ91_01070 [Parenemella sanctibonifatiensis]|uniref:Fluoride-specific ion channel FluC n=1 Tax=Parenemella sanctibonifatiensis TaxID=2016505 RepID=A0A255EMM9_9ACTN|nr:hypothetical protein CGZ91_01070 [Parenemella sanctibonifatiensis]